MIYIKVYVRLVWFLKYILDDCFLFFIEFEIKMLVFISVLNFVSVVLILFKKI